MPPPEPMMRALGDFLTASSWQDSRSVLNDHPELLNFGADVIDILISKDPNFFYPKRSRSEAIALLKTHRVVLMRCREVGVSRAIAEIEARGGSGRRSLETETTRPRRRRRRIIIGISLLAIAGAIAGTVVLLTSPGPHGNNYYVAVSSDGKFIASASSITHNVYLWDTASKRLIATLADPNRANDTVNAIALSPSGTMIAVAHTNDPVYLWDIATRRIVATITAGAGASGLAFSPDGKTLAICGTDVLLWDVASKRIKATLTTVKTAPTGPPQPPHSARTARHWRCRSTRTRTRTVIIWRPVSNCGISGQSASRPISREAPGVGR